MNNKLNKITKVKELEIELELISKDEFLLNKLCV